MIQVIIFDFWGVIFNPRTTLPTQDLIEFLNQLKQSGIKCGIASSSSSDYIKSFLKEHNLETYFESIIGTGEVSNTKPNPECYMKVAEHFQVRPIDCFIIDDSEAPLLAAEKLGFKTILFGDDVSSFSKINLQ